MKRAKAKPEEVWLYKDKWGSWDFSFDPPLKRHELKMVRMVTAAEADQLRAEVKRLRAALRSILREGSGPGYTEGDIATEALKRSK